ncbi:MAG: ATP-binding cassette domain-containing protein [Acidimicrobiia bacterium]|nr:ATP-binding cassette domain-containing protein [Acidimicrobiia bacterium]
MTAVDVAAIETERLTKSYGPHRGIVDVDLAVRPGEVFGFLGPNGAGKTTLIRVLLDLLRPTSGHARVLGLDPRLDGPTVRSRVAYLPRVTSRSYERLTGLEHLRWLGELAGGVDDRRIHETAEHFGLDLSRPIGQLSKGNRQKVGLCQVLMRDAELLVMDEPTGGLDPLVQHAFQDAVREIAAAGRTVFLSSHVLDEVQELTDRVAIIREGRIVAVRAVEEMRAESVRRLTVRFGRVPGDDAVAAVATLEGVRDLVATDSSLSFTLDGSIDPLIKRLAAYEVEDLVERTGRPRRGVPHLLRGRVVNLAIARREVLDRARGLVAWTCGFVFLLAVTIATYPSLRDEPGIGHFEEEIPDALRAFTGGEEFDFTSAPGLVNSRLLAFLLPLLVLVYVIGYGSRLVAGEHQQGRLDLVLSYPVTRRRVLAERLGVLVVIVGLFCALVALALTWGGLPVDLDLEPGGVLAACLMLGVLGLLFGALAAAAGAVTLERSLAYAVAGGYAAFAYFVNSLSALASWLEPVRPVSVFYWYGRRNPLLEGVDPVGLVVLGTLPARRRDRRGLRRLRAPRPGLIARGPTRPAAPCACSRSPSAPGRARAPRAAPWSTAAIQRTDQFTRRPV